ncbi:pannexin-1b isoform X1 [Siphateles boraxobius]|uniref:pannexin-1b isoform X1 n=1 Tax=Siphateles boraxobius TaxID=180520 RepID=UPI004064BDEE
MGLIAPPFIYTSSFLISFCWSPSSCIFLLSSGISQLPLPYPLTSVLSWRNLTVATTVPFAWPRASQLNKTKTLQKTHTGILVNESVVPDAVQCKLVAVGVFRLLSCMNLVVYLLLVPAVVYAAFQPARQHQHAQFLRPYHLLPTFGHVLDLQPTTRRYDDLSIYLLFLEENLSELKSYKCLQVLELLSEGGEAPFDTMCLLRTLGQVRTDMVDRKQAQTVNGNAEQEISEIKDVSSVLLDDGVSCSCVKDVRHRVV